MKSGRAEELAMHPTVKPVALVADAIKDVSKRKGIRRRPTAVLDATGQTFEDVEVARMAANDSAVATEEVA